MKTRIRRHLRLAVLALFVTLAVGGQGLHVLPGCGHGFGAAAASHRDGRCCESHGYRHAPGHNSGLFVLPEAKECAICKWLTQAKLPVAGLSDVAVFAPPADCCPPSTETRFCFASRTPLPRGPPA